MSKGWVVIGKHRFNVEHIARYHADSHGRTAIRTDVNSKYADIVMVDTPIEIVDTLLGVSHVPLEEHVQDLVGELNETREGLEKTKRAHQQAMDKLKEEQAKQAAGGISIVERQGGELSHAKKGKGFLSIFRKRQLTKDYIKEN